ncbi:MAG TPA: hypothetical protein VL221_13505 [Bacteroidota bacterium]|nr:hypothetical protein [Bacteroidota bacterium]
MFSRRTLVLTVIAAIPLAASARQVDARRDAFGAALRARADTLVAAQHAYADTLVRQGSASTAGALRTFQSYVDSLIRAAGDSLDSEARSRIRFTELGMRTTLGVMGYPVRGALRDLLGSFDRDLSILLGRSTVCGGCSSQPQFDLARRTFAAASDSIAQVNGDSMATLVEAWEDALDDSASTFSDSVLSQVELLKESVAGENQPEKSRLEVGAAYQAHASYRGRDDGITESSYGPTATYHHRSGLFAGGSIAWTSHPTPGPDDGDLTAGYEFDLSSRLDGSLSYTHYWYSDSSAKPQAVTNQSLGGMFTLDAEAVTLLADLSYDFGGGSGAAEFTATLDVSRDFLLPGRTLGGTLVLSPALGATWGDQDERLLERRLQRAKKKVVVVRTVKPSSIFGIMAYEFSLPARLTAGQLSVEPELDYVVPADVLGSGKFLLTKDPSSTAPFVSAMLTVTMTFE